jgi:hypothetical protein
MGSESEESVMVVLLREKKEKHRNSPIVIYLSRTKASERFRVVISTVDEAIRMPIIGNKRLTNATQPEKPRFKSHPLLVV